MIALLSADPDADRTFARDTLAGLSTPDTKTGALRETLRVYLLNNGSRTVTGKQLYIAVNTVSDRVAKAGDLPGRPAAERTVETLLARELAHYFPDFLA